MDWLDFWSRRGALFLSAGALKPQGRGVHPVRTSLGYVPVHVQYDGYIAVDEVDRMTLPPV